MPLAGDSANTVNVSNTLADAEGDFSGFTVSTGTGADTITGGEVQTITSAGGANVVVGADGNDTITTGGGGDPYWRRRTIRLRLVQVQIV